MWDRRAQLLRVKDGDTFVAVLDQGFGDTKEIDVRLYGVYAPEKKEPGGRECAEFVKYWLHNEAERTGAEWPFVVTTMRMKVADREQASLERYVATITSLDGARNLNLELSAYITQHGYGHGTV